MSTIQTVNKLNNVQNELLKTLSIFHNICIENHLRYYICGGTALGAVRHKGFIPWDDDIDVIMPGNDYEKLITSAKLPDGYCAFRNKNLIFGSFLNTNVRITHGNEDWDKIEPYLSIDIFPVYGTPNNKILRKIHITHSLLYFILIKLKRIKYIQKTEGMKNRATRPLKEKLLIKCGSIFSALLLPFSEEWLLSKLYSIAEKYNFDDSMVVGSYYGRYRYKDFFERKIFGNGKEITFECIQPIIMNDYDSYLHALYGDNYMEIPPNNNREKHGDLRILE